MYGTHEDFDRGFSAGINIADGLERDYIADTIACVEWAMESALDLADEIGKSSEEAYYRGMASALHQRYQKLLKMEEALYRYDAAV